MKIYYDKTTGDVLLKREEAPVFHVETTVEQDIATFKVLTKRDRSTFDVMELPAGKYAQDFAECTGFKVDPVMKKLIFAYGGDYMTPLSEQIEEMRVYAQLLSDDIQNLKQSISEF
ncbi:hypothetical protein [Fictibacillus terranigra]|uniref:Phage protein n=1 Tax=Fictibacillus terranigra TaxID=3058424 RepID=A0ABT8E6V8_9BACL|nr:hypothetical protein [Fictibacillus sp. CENA-BCM004]MDN4073625.1 hypothetical protein [Fictibacillus sp. CENA-BCM004]